MKVQKLTPSQMKAQIAKMNRENFDSFDDDFDPDMFDPDMFDEEDSFDDFDEFKGRKRRVGMSKSMAQLDLLLDNSQQAADQNFELFNSLRSCAEIRNVNLDATKIPMTLDGFAAVATNANFPNQTIHFNAAGDLVFRGASGSSYGKISCNQLPYRTLFKSSGTNPFIIKKVRLSVSNNAQIDQSITHFTNSMFGGIKENSVSPRAFFKPEQQQGLIVDIDNINFLINQEKGLRVKVLANQTLNMSIFISQYARLSNDLS